MDHLLVALLNTAIDPPDVLETPVGTARWWLANAPAAFDWLPQVKPRYDASLCAWLRDARSAVALAATGGPAGMPLAFRGDGSDAIRFEIVHAFRTAAASGGLRRVHVCRLRVCGRWFIDETKNGSRRWCSLRCMERARAPRRRTIAR